MTDLERVTQLAKERQEEAAREEQERIHELEVRLKVISENIHFISIRMNEFASSLKGKITITVKIESDCVRMVFSFYPEWAARPVGIVEIHPSSFGEKKYSLRYIVPEHRETISGCSVEEILDDITKFSADILSQKSSREWMVPNWYLLTGTALGWIVAAIVWFFVGVIGGGWGIFLGWIPAWIALALTKYFWLPAGFLLLFLTGS